MRDEAAQRETGNWFKKYSAEAQKAQERDEYRETQTSAGKMLDQFIRGGEGAEDEGDDDIYTRY